MAGDKFKNPFQEKVKKSLLDVILWQIGYFNDQEMRPKPPQGFTYPRPDEMDKEGGAFATFINHSTYLIEADGVNILTDPIYSKRCSPVPFIGPKRQHAPGVAFDNLPEIHIVLMSHDHYDHLCKQTVKRLHKRFPNIEWIVPTGLKKWFNRLGISKVVELAWWEHFILKEKGINITAVPSQHFSGRFGWHSNKTLWAGYVVEFQKISKRFYFVGDTGYNSKDFRRIGERFGSMDLSLIPIGTYTPLEFMAPVHISPERAVDIHCETRSSLSLGMHWKTFKLSSEGLDQPPYDLYCEMRRRNLNPSQFLPIEPGERVKW
jgi:N-acyl-phosphatidylethanolamine-hydrolysing phospholipase D